MKDRPTASIESIIVRTSCHQVVSWSPEGAALYRGSASVSVLEGWTFREGSNCNSLSTMSMSIGIYFS